MTGVGPNPGQCSLAFAGPVTATFVPGPPRRVVIAGNVVNNGTAAKRVSITIRYNRNGGPPMGSIRFGPASVPPGGPFPFSLNINVPGAAPPGVYNLTIELEDKTNTPPQICQTVTTTVTIQAPRIGATAVDVEALQEKGAPMPAGLAWQAAPAADGLFAPVVTADATTASTAVSPNPFAGRTTVSFSLAEATSVRLAVYDVLGREVAVLVDGHVEAGAHQAVFDARGLSAGTYVYRLVTGQTVQTGRLTLTQ
jgi:hypothetical protein